MSRSPDTLPADAHRCTLCGKAKTPGAEVCGAAACGDKLVARMVCSQDATDKPEPQQEPTG